uniref:Tail tape measure protein n=1 Tax=Podoviridae sp. ctyDR6 TaxID=2825288 RepID=A0A8S5QJF9_9CAUD|nr:MAG TPA: tail tape measure protein [Podoviridae sp. ctyDR6]
MNVLDLFFKISVDTSEVDKTLGDTKEKALSFGDVLKANIAGQAIVAGVKAVAGAVKNIGEAAIQSYGEYEQLIGGVETLFKSSADTVMQYAANAYQTAGMSANEYMTTVTAFSASLLQSMGGDTDAAAEKANLAITDMSDNANKMGSSMESIQNAYSGFAKQNYTMLDNLKLGYGGTKEEMQRLLDDANALNAAQGNYTNYTIDSYADIVDAIHTVQTEMGITGTTAEEAASTIEGSVNMMKSAWSNLVAGIADDNADLDKLIENFTYSVSKAAENIIPRIEKIFTGIGDLIVKLAPVISEQLPSLVSSVLPSLVDAATALVQGVVDAAPGIVSALADMAPQITGAILSIIPQLLDVGVQMLIALVQGIASAMPEIAPQLADCVAQIAEVLTQPDTLVALVEASTLFIVALVEGLVNNLPTLLAEAPKIVKNLASAFIQSLSYIGEAAIEIGVALIQGIWDGIKRMGDWLKSMVEGFFDGIVDGVKSTLGIHSPSRVFAGIGENMALGLGEGWDSEFGSIKRDISKNLDFGTASIDFGASGAAAIGNSIASGIGSMAAGKEGQIIINLTTELDGTVLARKMVPYNEAEAVRSGA